MVAGDPIPSGTSIVGWYTCSQRWQYKPSNTQTLHIRACTYNESRRGPQSWVGTKLFHRCFQERFRCCMHSNTFLHHASPKLRVGSYYRSYGHCASKPAHAESLNHIFACLLPSLFSPSLFFLPLPLPVSPRGQSNNHSKPAAGSQTLSLRCQQQREYLYVQRMHAGGSLALHGGGEVSGYDRNILSIWYDV